MKDDGRPEALEKRVRSLEANLEIIHLEALYARTWDTGDGAAWAGLFSEDGIFEIAAVGERPGSKVSGRTDLDAYCRAFNAHTAGIHLMHIPQVTVSEDAAEGGLYFEYRFLRRLDPPETISGTTAGYYEVRYRRSAAGWRIVHRLERPVVRDHRSFFTV